VISLTRIPNQNLRLFIFYKGFHSQKERESGTKKNLFVKSLKK